MSKRFSVSTRYAFAIGSIAVATLIRFFINPFLAAEFPFFTYYIAAVLTVWFSGFGPALVAVALGYLSADVFFYTLHGIAPDPLSIFIYLCVTLTISLFGKTMHDSKYRMELSMKEARQRQIDLEEEISRRLQAEKALALSEEEFRTSFELPVVGAAEVDPGTGRFVRVNSTLCRMTGYTREELLGMSARQITYPGDSDYDSKALRRWIEGGAPENTMERRYVCKNGRIIWVSIASSLIRDSDGQPWRTTTVIQDITAQRQAEESLKAAQLKLNHFAADLEAEVTKRTANLNQRIESMDQFCHSIAHDLRGPIRALHGYAQALIEDIPLPANATHYTERISQAAARMEQLVSSLLDYGRLSRDPVHLTPVRLEDPVDHALARLSGELQSSKAEVWVARPLPSAMADAHILDDVLASLLHNAVTFVAPGTAPVIHVRAEENGTTVRLCVEDNGIGIDPKYLDRIFKVFERLHPPYDYPGAGVGLAIVKKGIERLGGCVGVNSQPGSGSCFWFELPKAPNSRTAITATHEELAGTRH